MLPGGGGGTASLRVGIQNKTTDPRFCAITDPLSLPLLIYSPLFSRFKRTVYCYYCCYPGLPPVDIIFSCPVTITLITVAKTLIIANPGCFPWTIQANNYSPNRKCPTDSPPSESSMVCDSPLRVLGSVTAPSFLAYSHSPGSPFCSGYPKPG